MSWLDLIDRVIRRVREAYEENSAMASWLRKYGEGKVSLFSAPKDDELEQASEDLEALFDALDKHTNGKFNEHYDWYVERDSHGKIHLHVFEAD